MASKSKKKVVHYATVTTGNEKLLLFYTYDGTCWMWDEYKRSYEEAVKAYPKDEYKWVRI